jgi:hypothetical protein
LKCNRVLVSGILGKWEHFAPKFDMNSSCFQMDAGFRNSEEVGSLPTKRLGANCVA